MSAASDGHRSRQPDDDGLLPLGRAAALAWQATHDVRSAWLHAPGRCPQLLPPERHADRVRARCQRGCVSLWWQVLERLGVALTDPLPPGVLAAEWRVRAVIACTDVLRRWEDDGQRADRGQDPVKEIEELVVDHAPLLREALADEDRGR